MMRPVDILISFQRYNSLTCYIYIKKINRYSNSNKLHQIKYIIFMKHLFSYNKDGGEAIHVRMHEKS